jgi:hypothetical protein
LTITLYWLQLRPASYWILSTTCSEEWRGSDVGFSVGANLIGA